MQAEAAAEVMPNTITARPRHDTARARHGPTLPHDGRLQAHGRFALLVLLHHLLRRLTLVSPMARSSTDPAPHMDAASGAVGVTIIVGAAFAQCSSKCKCTTLAQSTKTSKTQPVFGMPFPTEDNTRSSKGNNKRSCKQLGSPKLTEVFEYARSANSMLGRVHSELKVPHVRLSTDVHVQDPRIAEQLRSELRDPAKKHLWALLPCTSGCPWHRVGVGLALNGAEYRKRHAEEVAASRALFKQFKEHAETALAHGHDVTFEWPRQCDSCKRKDVMNFFQDSRFMLVDFDGCRL